jgi:hypothetical protein
MTGLLVAGTTSDAGKSVVTGRPANALSTSSATSSRSTSTPMRSGDSSSRGVPAGLPFVLAATEAGTAADSGGSSAV